MKKMLRKILLKFKMKRKFSPWLTLALGLLFLQFIYLYAFFIEPNWIIVRRVRIKSPRLAQALKNFKVVQLSDLHIAEIGFLETSLIDKINQLRPDLLLLTGDFVDTKEGINACWDVLSLLEVKTAMFAIAGDMDDLHIPDLLADPRWKKAGVTLLDNRSLRLNLSDDKTKDFWLAGLHNSKDIKGLIEKIPASEPVILLSPDPDSIQEAARLNIDLVLSGDTHGGQINPRLLRSILPLAVENRSAYVAGLFKIKDTLLYVNRGIGTSHINARFLCWPEITVFEFVEKDRTTRPQVLAQDR